MTRASTASTLGYADERGTQPIGFAAGVASVRATGPIPILLIFGYDARSGEVLGLKVLENKETPGLGDEDREGDFAGLFWKSESGDRPARQPPLVGKRAEQFQVHRADQVDMITRRHDLLEGRHQDRQRRAGRGSARA